MLILVLNCGGSSVKYQLVEMPDERVLARGSVERIGKEDGELKLRPLEGPERCRFRDRRLEAEPCAAGC